MAIIIVDGIGVKWCPKSEEYVPVEGFSKNKCRPDGLQSYCKVCNKSAINEWIDKNRERYDQQKREYAREYYENNPDKYRKNLFAVRLSHAAHDGKINRPDSCSVCGSTDRIEGHHPDYEEGHELVVIWVCRSCHVKIHMECKK